MLKTLGSTESTIRPKKGGIGIGSDGVNGGGGCSGDFDMTFQVTRWRSGHCSSAKTVVFDCASETNYEKPIPVALD